MADHILFIGWNRAVVGREQQAIQLFEKTVEFYGKLQADGRIESFEPVLLSLHGGDLNGFFLLKGEVKKLAEIRGDETFLDLITEAGYCLEGVGIVPGFIGESLTKAFSRWSKLIGG